MSVEYENIVSVSGAKKELGKFKRAIKLNLYEKNLKYWEDVPSGSDYVLMYRFPSYWNPGLGLISFLSKKFSKLKFKLKYDECMSCLEGTAYIKNGEFLDAYGEIPGLAEEYEFDNSNNNPKKGDKNSLKTKKGIDKK